MAAYVLANIEVRDADRYEAYRRSVLPSIEAYGGRFLVRGGKVETLEGAWTPHRLVIIEFPTYERAKAWWASSEYRPARDLRHATARSELIVVEGV